MPENKAMLLYHDRMNIVNALSDEEAGELLKAMLAYSIDKTEKEFKSRAAMMAFISVRPDLDYSYARYEEICKKRSDAGKKGMAARWGKKRETAEKTGQNGEDITNAISVITNDNKNNQTNTNTKTNTKTNTNTTNTPSSDDAGEVSGKPDCGRMKKAKDEDMFRNEIAEIIAYLNEKTGKNFFSDSKVSSGLIKARLREGYTTEHFRRVIDNKTAQWNGTDMEKFLRPSTLFAADKFESYVNETPLSHKDRGMICNPVQSTQPKRKHYYDGEEIQRQLLAQFMDDPPSGET